MKVTRIDHVAINVENLEEAGKFFGDLFGTDFGTPGENQQLDIRNLMSPLGIELIAPLTADGPTARNLQKKGEGLALVSFEVTDFEQAVTEMKAKGIRQVGATGGNIAVFHPKDLHGVMVGIVGPK